jgi:deazaflavin-dependent oxidoreductase (nitroreductase family)
MPGVNKRFVNPLQRIWAPWLPPFALVEHTGRRSGHLYRTPVLALRSGGTLAIPLFYGRTDWVSNVLAAGGADVRRAGGRWRLTHPRIVDEHDSAQIPWLLRGASGKIAVLLLTVEDE